MAKKVKNEESSPVGYEQFLAQIKLESIHLDSLYFELINKEYEFVEVEDYMIGWDISYDETPNGFGVFVDIIVDVWGTGKDGLHQPFNLELCFDIRYRSELEFLENEYQVFGESVIIPLVWPYSREAARDVFSKAGIHQITDIPLSWR